MFHIGHYYRLKPIEQLEREGHIIHIDEDADIIEFPRDFIYKLDIYRSRKGIYKLIAIDEDDDYPEDRIYVLLMEGGVNDVFPKECLIPATTVTRRRNA